jgi:hypothetical protein
LEICEGKIRGLADELFSKSKSTTARYRERNARELRAAFAGFLGDLVGHLRILTDPSSSRTLKS